MKSPIRISIDKDLLEEAISLFDAPVMVIDAERKIILFNVYAEKLTSSKNYEAEGKYFGCLRSGLMAFVQGTSPIMAVEFARRAIPSEVRPTFQEMEKTCKGK